MLFLIKVPEVCTRWYYQRQQLLLLIQVRVWLWAIEAGTTFLRSWYIKTGVSLLALFCDKLTNVICVIIEEPNIHYCIVAWYWFYTHVIDSSIFPSWMSVESNYSSRAYMASKIIITKGFVIRWKRTMLLLIRLKLFLVRGLRLWVIIIMALLMMDAIKHFEIFVHYLW